MSDANKRIPFRQMYADQYWRIMQNSDPNQYAVTTTENVFQPALKINQPFFYEIIRDLLLPDSGVSGAENLRELHSLSKQGKSCLILSAHFSNFDVPVLFTLLKDHGPEFQAIFDDIVFVAGRKLTEGEKSVKAMAEIFTRLVISPKTANPSPEEAKLQMAINRAAQKKMNELKNAGHIFLVYPTGTRVRPWNLTSARGMREIYNYLRNFDYFLTLGMEGNLMVPQPFPQMIEEFPSRDRMRLNFGRVRGTDEFLLQSTLHLGPDDDAKQVAIDQIMEEIYSLGDDPRQIYCAAEQTGS